MTSAEVKTLKNKIRTEIQKARILASVYYWNTYHKKMNDGLYMDLWVPKQWAIPIIFFN